MSREDSNDVSGEDLKIERSQRSVEPYAPSEKVSRASSPLTIKRHLDVDAVLERSLRKVAGE
jgi:hypothetical protein